MRIIHDITLAEEDEVRITELLMEAFKEYKYPKRSYYKQRPHFRCLYEKNNYLIGYAGLDYRVMNIDGRVKRVLGIIDLAVDIKYRNQGIAGAMLEEIESFSKSGNVDLIMLFADNPRIYKKHGFVKCNAECSLLMIDEHKTYGTKTDKYPETMIKLIDGSDGKISKVDMLGYLY